jgi:hypothetical protein
VAGGEILLLQAPDDVHGGQAVGALKSGRRASKVAPGVAVLRQELGLHNTTSSKTSQPNTLYFDKHKRPTTCTTTKALQSVTHLLLVDFDLRGESDEDCDDGDVERDDDPAGDAMCDELVVGTAEEAHDKVFAAVHVPERRRGGRLALIAISDHDHGAVLRGSAGLQLGWGILVGSARIDRCHAGPRAAKHVGARAAAATPTQQISETLLLHVLSLAVGLQ